MNVELEIAVRTEILNQLKKVTEANSPAIYLRVKTERGYQFIERLIIERMVSTQLTIDGIIPQIEQELNGL